MKSLLILTAFGLASLQAAPTDAEILKLVQERAKLERVTQKPSRMEPEVATLCAPSSDPVRHGPHEAAKLHVYANEPAALPIFDPWGKFPEGSFILKEKLGWKDSKTTLFTAMFKREKGYFPEVGDWEFLTIDAKAEKITERGKLQSCAECHKDYAKGDFVTKLYAAPTQLSGGRVVLHSSKAIVHGTKLHYEKPQNKNTLGFWVVPTDWAEWKFDLVQPGTYTIHLWQGCGNGSGGSEIEVRCADQSNKFIVEETGHFQKFKERQVGTLKFDKAGPQTLELRALKKPGGAVMDCPKIMLVPVK